MSSGQARGRAEDTAGITRCLKRYVADEVYTLIVNPPVVPAIDDLRPLRKAKKITLQRVADEFDVYTTRVSRIELGKARDDDFVSKYRNFLLQAS